MERFDRFEGLVVPLERSNVDTDQIIPKQYLKSIKRSGFGPNLFDSWRYLDPGEPDQDHSKRRPDPRFVLNEPRYAGAGILLAGDNFGCGSSREHAAWALLDYGIRVVIAPRFAEIFYNNCFKNGLLPVALAEETVRGLFKEVSEQKGYTLRVDLPAQTVTTPDGAVYEFEVDPGRKYRLMEGLDDIGLTLQHADKIREFELRRREAAPWLYSDSPD